MENFQKMQESMQDKYILILGAGLMQRPSIEAAKNLGYKTLVVDANPDAVCASYADRFEPVDLKDKEKLAALALSMGDSLCGVFTAGTDFSRSVAYVASRCGFKSHSFEAADNASHKVHMRQCFMKEGVSSPAFQRIERNQVANFITDPKEVEFPKVVKPVDNMGARGCRLIRNFSELIPSIETAVRYSRHGTVILEDYMEGPEYSIDALVYKNTVTITGFADRHIFFPPYFIETGHTMPTVVDKKKRNELIACFVKGIKALGLTCGAAKADIKYTDKGPMIGEIAARLSGGYMSGWTYPYSSGLNLTEQAMLIALGKQPKELLEKRVPLKIKNAAMEVYEVPCVKVSAERAWISIPGKISKVFGLDKAQAAPYIQNVFLRCREGDSVDFPRNNVEKCGNVISCAGDYNEAVKASEGAVSNIVLRLQKNNKATKNFLEGVQMRAESGFPYPAFSLSKEQVSLLEKFAEKVKVLKADEKLMEKIEPVLAKVDSLGDVPVRDFNHRSLAQTVRQFDSICTQKPDLEALNLIHAMVRGGIQGMLFVADSTGDRR